MVYLKSMIIVRHFRGIEYTVCEMYMAYIIYLVLYHSTFVSSIKGPHCIVKALGFLIFLG